MVNGKGIRRGMRIAMVKVVFLAALAGGGALQAQTQEPAKPAAGTEQATPTNTVIKTESRIVLVDAVVTDKKGHYITNLTQGDFKVYEDNKEQAVTSFSSGSDSAVQAAGQKHYMILFFDTSSMELADQMQARNAATKFIESNSGTDQLMAVVNFGGSLVIRQNFTANATLLKAAVSGTSVPNIETNGQTSQPVVVATLGMPSLSNAEADFGARSMLLSIRSLAKNLRAVPGRKMLILFTAGFPLSVQNTSELTATIDACNKANVAVYPLDVRGLATGAPPMGSARVAPKVNQGNTNVAAMKDGPRGVRPRLVRSSYTAASMLEPQKPGGGGGGGTGGGGGRGPGGGTGGTGGGGGRGSGGGTGGTGGTGGGGKGGTGGTGGTGSGGKGGTGGTGGGGKGGTGGGGARPVGTSYGNPYINPMNQPNILLPKIPPSVSDNQQMMQMLAEGTGGFAIYNTNGLLEGLQRIAQEMSQFYVLGYVPQATAEGSCHTLKVKLNKGGGMEVRSRTGYCNVRPSNPLEGKPMEKVMEAQASGAATGTIHASLQAPYFYAAPNVALVNLAMEIPGDAVVFNKDKGKYHANVNVLGIAYKPDGTVGARFSDTLNFEMEKDEWKEFAKQPYRYQNQFDASPGNYKLTVILSSGGEGFAKMETPLQIDVYDGNNFTLGGVVLSSSLQRVDEIPTEVDAALLEDRKALIVKGMQITPAASYQFKKTDNVTLYSELYEPLLKTAPATKVLSGYRIFDKATNKEVFFTGGVPLDTFVQKGNSVVPFALKVDTKDLQPGNYRLVLLAVDEKNQQAPQRPVEFTLSN